LELLTPTGFGNGDTDGITDMSLLRDPLEGRALLTGASLAGSLRNYLWETEQGYEQEPNRKKQQHKTSLTVQLFGALQGDPEGAQSPLLIDDALGVPPRTELRDGVRIDAVTRTAKAGQKFDYELLRAGTTFPLRFELLLAQSAEEEQTERLREALVLALRGLEKPGEIHLGVRKRRGFGECQVKAWRVTEYDLTKPAGLLAWLNESGQPKEDRSIANLLLAQPQAFRDRISAIDRRCWFRLSATLGLESSLLMRSGIGPLLHSDGAEMEANNLPDTVHIHRLHADTVQRTPVLPGTSIAGVLRHRALRIAQTLHPTQGAQMINKLFGIGPEGRNDGTHTGSRVHVAETVIEAPPENVLVQNRIRIDRFTGGVLDNLLFDEAPLFGNEQVQLRLDIAIRQPSRAEIGLFLLILKDLWLADLPLGGGANIGRGRVSGRHATLHYQAAQVQPAKAGPAIVTAPTTAQPLPAFHLRLETVQQVNDQPMLRLVDLDQAANQAQAALAAMLEECVQTFVNLEATDETGN
jgi:CRISPR/Cas system CSM-associated protein Csm3 (group 7 of RAMP superfamily)